MTEALEGLEPDTIPSIRIGTEWTYLQILTDPIVVYRNKRYLPAVLVEETNTENRGILFITAMSIAEIFEPIRETRGALVGVNLRIHRKGEDKFSTYEIEELTD